MKYKTPKEKAKATAWKWFSLYVRTRDCLKTTGRPDVGRCYTCGKIKDIKELQAGHLVSGRRNGVLFQEDGVHAQCVWCNKVQNGNAEIYMEKMIEDHGKRFVEALIAQKYITIKYTEQDYREIADFYRKQYNELKGE